jgi:hypothetical protein
MGLLEEKVSEGGKNRRIRRERQERTDHMTEMRGESRDGDKSDFESSFKLSVKCDMVMTKMIR